MNLHESYVSLETAKMLKQAGFDWECEEIWDSKLSKFRCVPILSVAQKWLIEVKNIIVYVCPSFEPLEESDKWMLKYQVSAVHSDIEADIMDLSDIEEKCFDTYEEALESGIKKCLTLILE